VERNRKAGQNPARVVAPIEEEEEVQGDQKVSVHLMITIQKVTSSVQNVPRRHRIHAECGLCYTEHGLREHSLACQ